MPPIRPVSVPTIVLAGGLGTRLRGITNDRYPKPMVPVPHGKTTRPFLEFVLEHLHAQQCLDVTICVGHLGDAIRQHFGDGGRFGLRIAYDDAGVVSTGARVLSAIRRLPGEEFLVVCGDTYHPLDLAAFVAHLRERPHWQAQLATVEPGPGEAGNVVMDANGTVIAYNAAGLAGRDVALEAGTLMMRKSALARLTASPDLSLAGHVYAELIRRGAIGAMPSRIPLFDIGTSAGYHRFCSFVEHGGVAPGPP